MRQKILRSISITAALVVLATSVLAHVTEPRAAAVTGANWNAGHIIDDSIFFNKDSMTVDQIQAFLNAKVPTCAIWHSSSDPNNQPPYTCLKDYQENISTHENNFGKYNSNGTPYQVPGGETAARIIWGAAQDYGINPQVLIVTLQKEQGLVTDDWPWYVEYQKAMGYGCPDTAPCDSQYYGLYNQVENAAWQFRQYGIDPSSYLYTRGVTRYIGYNPNSSCGGTNVYIDNQATADLYNYTPYQPDQAALNNLYGTGDGCSTYGNRNFWRYFNDWFGSTSAGDTQVQIVSDLTISPSSNILADDSVHARFTLRNNTSQPVYIGGMAVAVRRLSDNANFDYALRDVTVPAGGAYTYDEAQALPSADYSFEIVNYRSGVGWTNTYPYSLYNTLIRKINSAHVQPAVQLTSGINFSTMAIVPGKSVTASFQITNPNSTSVNIGTMAVTGRDASGNNVDFSADQSVTIPANSTYTYSKTRSFTNLGNYSFTLSNYRDGIGWNSVTPSGTSGHSLSVEVKANPRVISGLTITPSNPVVGENVTASFQIRNDADSPVNIGTMAVAARDPSGKNVDFAPDQGVTIPANSTYTYSMTQAFSMAGPYNLSIVNYQTATGWRGGYPALDTGTSYSISPNVLSNPLVASSLTTSPVNPLAGQNVTATFQIRNDAEYSVNIGTMAVAARDPSGKNVDFSPDANISIAPHTTYTYSMSQPFTVLGAYKLSIVNYQPSSGWTATYPASTPSIVRQTTVNTLPNPTVTTSLQLTPASPVAGQNVTASFTITNNGDVPMNIGTMAVAVRGPQGQNFDYAADTDVTVPAHGSYTYSKVQAFSVTGSYNFYIVNYRSGYGWTSTYPSAASGVTTSLNASVNP